jgi:hypothetical protein
MKKIFYILFAFVVLSCQRNQFSNESKSISKLENIKLLQGAWLVTNITPEQQRVVSSSSKAMELSKILVENKNQNTEKLSDVFKNFISTINDPIEKKYFSQFVANYAFRNTNLFDEPISEKRAEAIAYYTNLLLESQSGDAEILFNGLYNLRSVWSNDKILNAINASEEAMKSHLVISESQDNKQETANKAVPNENSSRAKIQKSVEAKKEELYRTYKDRQLNAQKMLKAYKETL